MLTEGLARLVMNRGWGWLFAVAGSVVVAGTRLHGAV